MRLLVLALALVACLAACTGTNLSDRKAGQTCSTSSECENGLLCNLDKDPHVCAGMSSLDAPPPDAAIDAHPLHD
jgi:hypothetical protein